MFIYNKLLNQKKETHQRREEKKRSPTGNEINTLRSRRHLLQRMCRETERGGIAREYDNRLMMRIRMRIYAIKSKHITICPTLRAPAVTHTIHWKRSFQQKISFANSDAPIQTGCIFIFVRKSFKRLLFLLINSCGLLMVTFNARTRATVENLTFDHLWFVQRTHTLHKSTHQRTGSGCYSTMQLTQNRRQIQFILH